MTAFTYGTTSGVTCKDVTPRFEKKTIEVTVPATFVWGTDTIVIDLAPWGAKAITGFLAFEETTAGSVVVAGTGTCAVATTTLTFASTGSTANTCGGTLILFLR